MCLRCCQIITEKPQKKSRNQCYQCWELVLLAEELEPMGSTVVYVLFRGNNDILLRIFQLNNWRRCMGMVVSSSVVA